MEPQEQQTVRHRPWLAPAIALVIALIFLLILLIPGVLRYRGGVDEARLAALRDSNAALEVEVRRLAEADAAGICMYDGALFPRSVEQGTTPPAPSQRLDLLPPPPVRLVPDPSAVPDQAAFEGSLDDLLRRGTVMVLAAQPQGMGNGTAFFIDSRHLVTSGHVVAGVEEVIVTNDLIRQPVTARVIGRANPGPGEELPQEDFALLQLSTPIETALPLRLGQARRTQVVYASGYPGFYLEDRIRAYYDAISQSQEAVPPEAVVTDGMVTTIQSVQREGGPLDYIPHTARISPGSSGGPLVDACGRVVGINTFVTQSARDDLILHGDYALSAGSLAAFLQRHGAEVEIVQDVCMAAGGAGQAGTEAGE